MTKHKRATRTGPARAIVLVAALVSACAPAEAADEAAGADLVELDAKTMLADLEDKIETARDKFLSLADAVPEDRWDWRPMEGVRSFREVFIHIAADNWWPTQMGYAAPDDIGVTDDLATIGTYQQQRLTKGETLEHMRRSFDFLLESLDQSRDRLDEPIALGQRDVTIARIWVELTTHMHEHLGQTVAYARMNEIVPPWSR